MATKQNKVLNLSTLKQAHDEYFKKKKVAVEINSKQYSIILDAKFELSKIQEMIFELANVYKSFIGLEDVWSLPLYSTFLLLKYFTDLDVKNLTYEEAIYVVKYLNDFDVLDTIMSGFDQKELDKFNEHIRKINNNIVELSKKPEILEDFNEMFEVIKDGVIEDSEADAEEVKTGDIDGTV